MKEGKNIAKKIVAAVMAAMAWTMAPGAAAQTDIDTLAHVSHDGVDKVIKYQARDSVALDLTSRRAVLFSDGIIDYDSMLLRADRIEVDFDRHTLHAHGTPDTAGHTLGRPFFVQDGTEYHADTITFNYDTKKGIISGVITQEGDGFLHGKTVKKVNDSVMFLSGGSYTTCNYAHPHFAINFTKSKLITGSRIVTGPAWLSIEDVPTPVALPFAFFPITKSRTSGVLIPSYGWQNYRGYYLRDGGYYFALGDNWDLSLLADLYTNLSWALEAKSNYYKRYKYKGDFDARYGITYEGIRGDSNTFNAFSDFKFTWRHEQDAKANPYSRFSANVNLQSRNYNRNTTNRNDYFNSTTTSSISFSTKLGAYFNLALSARESYNVQTGVMNIKLPSLSLSSITVYPLRRANPVGGYRWWENISLSYVLNAENNVTAADSELFTRQTLDRLQYGVQQSVPLSSSIKVLRFFNWTNSLTYNERWHWSTIEKNYDDATGIVTTDTVRGFRANRDFNFSSSLNTRIYGLFQFRHGPLKALRHVVSPTVAFSWHPDFGVASLGWWRQYTDTTGYVHRYSIFQNSLYGGPADGRSGSLRFSVGNNLEVKWQNPFDTTADVKKIPLIENLTLSMSYDLAKDSLRLSPLSVSGRTTLFRSLVLNYSGSFSPYVIDTLGRLHDQFLWDTERRLFRTDNSTWSTQLTFSLNNNTFSKDADQKNGGRPMATILQTPYNYNPVLMTGGYVDFSVPWNVSISYTFSYVNTFVAREMDLQSQTIQSITLSGNVSLTKNWRASMSTGYDLANKGWSYTTVDIYRDLHCWEMRFSWVPFGYYRSWFFQINIKAYALRDVKYEKRQHYQENNGYYSY
ncbi:MAG: LPS-assembly protein LptD [Bacteroidales bacterium]|nr:LPS-assembly protein LptD [Bacteroidales bacterium]